MKKIAQEQAEKNKKSSTKKSTVSGRKKEGNTSEASASQKPVMDHIWNELKEIRKDMLRLPELCAWVTVQHIFTIMHNIVQSSK